MPQQRRQRTTLTYVRRWAAVVVCLFKENGEDVGDLQL